MDRKIVIMLTVGADSDLPGFMDLNDMESPVIEPMLQVIIRIREGPIPEWRHFDVDGYSFDIKPDGKGGLSIGRNTPE